MGVERGWCGWGGQRGMAAALQPGGEGARQPCAHARRTRAHTSATATAPTPPSHAPARALCGSSWLPPSIDSMILEPSRSRLSSERGWVWGGGGWMSGWARIGKRERARRRPPARAPPLTLHLGQRPPQLAVQHPLALRGLLRVRGVGPTRDKVIGAPFKPPPPPPHLRHLGPRLLLRPRARLQRLALQGGKRAIQSLAFRLAQACPRSWWLCSEWEWSGCKRWWGKRARAPQHCQTCTPLHANPPSPTLYRSQPTLPRARAPSPNVHAHPD